jgi:molecular chaperone HscA
MAKIAINIATGSLQQNDIVVGIDLGTTNSLIAAIHPESKKPTILKEFDNVALVPSVVHIDAGKNITVGQNATPFLTTNPENTVFSVKRLIGKKYSEIESYANRLGYKLQEGQDDTINIKVDETNYNAVEISGFILKELKQRAEHILKTPVTKAVVTVPAYFNDAQRQATKEAGKLAGIDILRIVNEPTAASLAYGFGLNKTEQKVIAVYDLGGGTFDISILKIQDGVFEVLATNGDTFLGGDDIDQAILLFWNTKYQTNLTTQHRLVAEEAKKTITPNIPYHTIINGQNITLNQSELETIVQPIIQATLACCAQALKDAKLEINSVSDVVMVGGSTRLELIKKAVGNFFNKTVNDTVNPDEVVALGAAIQADILAGNTKDILLLDVTPLSLGVETAGGLMDVLLPRNTKIPTAAARQYTTQRDGQSGIVISVYQGERDLVADNRKLDAFTLSGIPNMPAGFPKVEIKFFINADGILKVSAKELRTGLAQEIEIKPKENLKDEDVEKMLLDSMQNAEADIEKRALVEAQTEAEQLLKTTESFIQKNVSLLTQRELTETINAMQVLQFSLTLNDKALIQSKTEALNNLTRPYAERIMDAAIGNAMQGKKI